ncbi:MAG: AF1514 family protein [Pseudomonadota bacterium]
MMEKIDCRFTGYVIDFEQAKGIARILAERGNEFATLISWCDRDKGVHSPHCLQCEIKGEQAWEVYGRNHEGRLRISFDDDRFVFIYS